ncbi:hypothetical protein [Dysgonomonas sp. ZJ709]|uniref:hypothetical protein n=1 Tax=Dysgonomonas sp. ZJ709 TaxID=2709797 RepID=UPI0013ECC5FF|nr:hypothetical protein [Dysgonomonas sp. ZJ709]
MKKTLLLLVITVFTLSVYAQSAAETNYYNGIESKKDLNLSADQVAKIKKLNREVGPKFAEIGKDRSLSGYEKGQKKRALSLQHKAEIQKILTENQIAVWESKYGKMHNGQGIKDSMTDNIDAKLDALERKYKADEDAIENNKSLSKEERKARKNNLKAAYKGEKQKLKDQKDAVRNTELLR